MPPHNNSRDKAAAAQFSPARETLQEGGAIYGYRRAEVENEQLQQQGRAWSASNASVRLRLSRPIVAFAEAPSAPRILPGDCVSTRRRQGRGVCAGLAAYFDVDVTIVRLV